jgi:Eco47II restriction endonuclease
VKEYHLDFISDKNIFEHVEKTVKKYRFNINLKKFRSNLIDPIKLTFDSKVYKKEIEYVLESEVNRQIDKSNTNHIGYFHQNIFGFIGNGWAIPKKGYDVTNEEKNIYVEMKNKHNTMNSSSSQKTYMRMQNTLIKNPNATCMLVEVIASNSQNIKWTISLDGESISQEKIRRVSIDKFYEIVTGDKLAFKKLCSVLPMIIQDVVENSAFLEKSNTVVAELKQIDPNLLKSIYLLSFQGYEGFDEFHI